MTLMTPVLAAPGDPPPQGAIATAVEALRDGDIIGIPTDTVYGLAADPWHSGAADRLFRVKGRPRSVELPVLVSGVGQALELATAVPDCARRLMARFWPGALTLVLPRREDLSADLGEDDATIGLRCPNHPVPLALCRSLGPIATSSANRHGATPVTTAQALAAGLPGVALVLDAGVCDHPPSTVVDTTGELPKLLRAGSISWEEITAAATKG
jgi:tRNA threonylcarbamoyl adenosine modification protein (Sua5/YciO/YrdC/YwlC family)